MARPATLALTLCFFLSDAAWCGTLVVAPSGADFDDIVAAVSAAQSDDTVLVDPGEYNITEPIDFAGKRVALRSTSGPAETIIVFSGGDGDSVRESILIFESGETATTVVEGFTLRGGRGTGRCDACVRRGGAIWCTASSPTLRDLRIEENTAIAGGGVFLADGAAPRIEECVIHDNEAEVGGGLYVSDRAAPHIADSIVRRNRASVAGGAYCGSSAALTFEAVDIGSNIATEGGGLVVEDATTTLFGCHITSNESSLGAGLVVQMQATVSLQDCRIVGNSAESWGGAIFADQASVQLANSIIAANSAPSGSAIHATRTLVLADHVTVTRNSAFGNTGWCEHCLFAFDALDPASQFKNSIIWGNDSEGFSPGAEFRFSHLFFEDDPLFCGWTADALWVNAASVERGDGSEASPLADLGAVVAQYSLALGEGSPCRGVGEDGSDLGADLDSCGDGTRPPDITLAAGRYPVAGFSLEGRASLAGAGPDQTTLVGTIRGLAENATLEGVTVTAGQDCGVQIPSGSPTVRACHIVRNKGAGVWVGTGNCTILDSVVAENFSAMSEFCCERSLPHGIRAENGNIVIGRSTIARNEAAGLSGGGIAVRSSIVWGNGQGSVDRQHGTLTTLLDSCFEGGTTSGGLDADPQFCGWRGADVLDVSGVAELLAALDGTTFDYSLSTTSPFVSGDDQAGAPTGTCGPTDRVPRLELNLTPGVYALEPVVLVDVDLVGAGGDLTLIAPRRFRGLRLVNASIATARVEGSVDITGSQSSGLFDTVVAGRVHCPDGNGVLIDCVVGGVTTAAEHLEITGTAVEFGVICSAGDALLHDCFVSGGVTIAAGHVELTNCTVAGAEGAGIATETTAANATLTNCIVWRNLRGAVLQEGGGSVIARFSCIERGWDGEGNIHEDPRFCGSVGPDLEVAGSTELADVLIALEAEYNYSLRSDSPCLTSGLDGARMGTSTGSCAADDTRAIVLTSGRYSIDSSFSLEGVILRGTSQDDVVIERLQTPLGSRSRLENVTVRGSGIRIAPDSDPVIRDVRVDAAETGIMCSAGSTPRIENTIITLCTGTGVYCEPLAAPWIERSTIVENFGPGIALDEEAAAAVESSIVWGNREGPLEIAPTANVAATFSCFDTLEPLGGSPETGNINTDPRFCRWSTSEVQLTTLEDLGSLEPTHSFGLAADSPCRSAGKSGVDMGASLSGCASAGATRLVILLPAGEFDANGMAQLPNHVELRGAGAGETVLDGGARSLSADVAFTGLTFGGGLWVQPGRAPRIEGCEFLGTLVCEETSHPVLSECTIHDAWTGVDCRRGATPVLEHCTVARNLIGVSCESESQPVIRNSIVAANALGEIVADVTATPEIEYSCVEGETWPGMGNIRSNPRFCGFPTAEVFVDSSSPTPGDGTAGFPYKHLSQVASVFRLSLLQPSSPCIGAAEGGRNMGAALGTEWASLPRSTVHLAPGSYDASTIPPGIDLLGDGTETTAVAGLTLIGNATTENLSSSWITAQAGSPRIRACEVGEISNDYGATPIVEDCNVGGIRLEDSRDDRLTSSGWAAIHGCELRGPSAAIRVSGLRVRIEECIIEGSSGTAIDWEGCGRQGSPCDDPVSGRIRGCRIVGNRRGINIRRGSPRIERCFIADNLGAGISVGGGSPPIVLCTIVGNSAPSSASGVERYLGYRGQITIDRCVVWGNAGHQLQTDGGVGQTPPSVRNSSVEGMTGSRDPMFIGWGGRPPIHVGTPLAGEGDGTAENPFASLAVALDRVRFNYAVKPHSPILTLGPGETEIGAGAAIEDGWRSSQLEVHFAAGKHEIGVVNLAQEVSILGAGQELTVLSGGELRGLRTGARIEDVTIERAGVWIGGGDAPQITWCTFRRCSDAIRCCKLAKPRIRECRFYHNWTAISDIRALNERLGPAPLLSNCEIVENETGITLFHARNQFSVARLEHCTIAHNTVGIGTRTYTPIEIVNSIIWGNNANPVSEEPPVILSSLVNVNPRFRALPSIDDRGTPEPEDDVQILGDYRLQSSSPAIDFATTSSQETDLLGVVRPCGNAYDAGAYEYCPEDEPRQPFIRGDCNGDGEVQGVSDAVFLLSYMFAGTAAPLCDSACDVNGDGRMQGVTDAVALLNFFFSGTAPSPPPPYPDCGLPPDDDPSVLRCVVPPQRCTGGGW